MALIHEIQAELVNTSQPNIANTLRKCLILAGRLNHDAFKGWIRLELEGYSQGEGIPPIEVPRYRIIYTSGVCGDFKNQVVSFTSRSIPIDHASDEVRTALQRIPVYDPIARVQALAIAEGDQITRGFAPKWLANEFCQQTLTMCVALWNVIPAHTFKTMVDAVRNRLLNFTLELETALPQVSQIEVGSGLMNAEPGRIDQVFNQTIMRADTVVVASGHNVSLSLSVVPGDKHSLRQYLTHNGVPADAIADLDEALDSDKEPVTKDGFGPRVSEWLKTLPMKGVEGMAKIGGGIAQGVIVKALCEYYGVNK